MFPGRFWAALGSGEASNERVTGEAWPRKEVRDQRLVECVDVIRRLLNGEEVSHEGLVHVNRARLWTLPETVPDLVGPAVTPETAARHAAWADGLITVNQPHETLQKVLDSYREAGGRGPARLQIHLSWAATEDEALAIAHDQWRSNVFAPPVCWDVESIEAFDVISENVSPEQVKQSVRVSSDLGQHTAWLQEYVDAGLGRAVPALRRQGAVRLHRRIRRTRPAAAVAYRAAGGDRMRRSDTGDLWWKNAVFYCADVETFYDCERRRLR